jgi:DNA-binding response OmpR family regulator
MRYAQASRVKYRTEVAMKILLVDDNELFVESLVVILQFHGYEFKIASNGIDAIEIVKKFKPDMVILDLMMPQMNGLEVCSHIKSNPVLKYIHIMVLSAKHTTEDRKKAMNAGADDYCIKPFSPNEILERIRQFERVDSPLFAIT